MTVKTKQALAVMAGLVVAVVMMLLGLWQMSSYEESTRDVSAERAAEAPVSLTASVANDGTIQDIYGKRVTLSGRYVPDHQVTVGDEAPWRVATLFQLDDGRYVTIVRGSIAPDTPPPAAPGGTQDVEGIFLAPDKSYSGSAEKVAELPTLRVQELAQRWPAPLIAGYVTLTEAESATQGLGRADLELPEAEGSPTHRGYALQWWVFAAGAIAFGIYAARGFAKDEERRLRATEEAKEAAERAEDATQATEASSQA